LDASLGPDDPRHRPSARPDLEQQSEYVPRIGRRAGGAGTTGSSIGLPFTDIMRSEAVVAAVAVGQTLGLAALFGTWIAVAFGPTARSLRTRHAAVERPMAPTLPGDATSR
jgi:hypothetical protein